MPKVEYIDVLKDPCQTSTLLVVVISVPGVAAAQVNEVVDKSHTVAVLLWCCAFLHSFLAAAFSLLTSYGAVSKYP